MGAVSGHERFERLFDEQFSRCVHVANKIVRDRAVAEEVASEAFARAWSRWNRLGRDDRVEGWVMRVTVNLAIDMTRKKQPVPQAHLPALSPADSATLHVALVQALQALPKRQREAIVLRYLADLSESDVSAALGVSAGSVKTHLHRGMERLRDTLGPDDDLEVRLVHGA
jgi:RNA polymerase sigma-70 factor (ECF subfamily)